MTPLDDLPLNVSATIVRIDAPPADEQRLAELGVFVGEHVTVLARAPLGDPVEVQLADYRLSLRRAQCRQIGVEPA